MTNWAHTNPPFEFTYVNVCRIILYLSNYATHSYVIYIIYGTDKIETDRLLINLYNKLFSLSNLMTSMGGRRNSEWSFTTPSIWMCQRHTGKTVQYFQSKASPVSFSPPCTLWQSWQCVATTQVLPEAPILEIHLPPLSQPGPWLWNSSCHVHLQAETDSIPGAAFGAECAIFEIHTLL